MSGKDEVSDETKYDGFFELFDQKAFNPGSDLSLKCQDFIIPRSIDQRLQDIESRLDFLEERPKRKRRKHGSDVYQDRKRKPVETQASAEPVRVGGETDNSTK